MNVLHDSHPQFRMKVACVTRYGCLSCWVDRPLEPLYSHLGCFSKGDFCIVSNGKDTPPPPPPRMSAYSIY